jgi:hypothetical protein
MKTDGKKSSRKEVDTSSSDDDDTINLSVNEERQNLFESETD